MLRSTPIPSLFLLMLISVSLSGQVNSYFENNPKWKVQSQCAIPYPCIETKTYMHYIQGDTVLDGIEYMKLNTFGEASLLYMDNGQIGNCFGSEIFYGPSYLIRSENRRMYMRESYSVDEEILLYDFNLEVGDTLPDTYTNSFGEHIIVTGIDSIEVNDGFFQRFELLNGNAGFLIEGIGSPTGLFSPMGVVFECGYGLICYSQNDIAYYDSNTGLGCELTVSVTDNNAKPNITISPHPLTEKSTLKLDGIKGPVTLTIHDLTGKVVHQNNYTSQSIILEREGLQPGLYLLSVNQNGRSVSTTKLIVGD